MSLSLSSKPEISWKLSLAIMLAISIGLTLFYSPLASFSVQESDGGEIAAAAYLKSLAHPPGYPLFILLAHFFIELFPENPYHAVAMLSGILQAIAAGLLFLTIYWSTRSILLGISGSIAWGLAAPTLRTAADAEIFALHHCLIIAAILVLTFNLEIKKSAFNIFLFGIILGMAGAHHHAIVLWLPMLACLLFSSVDKRSWPKSLALAVFGFSLGISSYLLLFLTNGPPLAYPPIDSLNTLIKHALRFDYGTFSLHGAVNQNENSYIFNFGWFVFKTFPVFLAVSFLVIFRQTKALTTLGFLLLLFLHFWFLIRFQLPQDEKIHVEFAYRFYAMLYLPLIYSFVLLPKNLLSNKKLLAILALLAILPTLLELKESYYSSAHSRDRTIDFELEAILREAPNKAIFLSSLDRIGMGLLYKQLIAHKRPDLCVINATMLGNPRYRKIISTHCPVFKPAMPLNSISDLTYWASSQGIPVLAYHETALPPGFARWPLGVTWQWLSSDLEVSNDEISKRYFAFCSRWPDGLGVLPKGRYHSLAIIDLIYLQPLIYHAKHNLPLTLQQETVKILQEFQAHNLRKTRSLCQSVLSNYFHLEDVEAKVYN